jgi:hypothetical protein
LSISSLDLLGGQSGNVLHFIVGLLEVSVFPLFPLSIGTVFVFVLINQEFFFILYLLVIAVAV